MPLLSFVSLFLWKRKTTLFWPKKGLPPYRGRRQSPKFISHHQNCGPSNPRARREGGGMVLGRKMDQGEHFLKGFYFVLVLLKVAPVFNLIFLFDWICILLREITQALKSISWVRCIRTVIFCGPYGLSAKDTKDKVKQAQRTKTYKFYFTKKI